MKKNLASAFASAIQEMTGGFKADGQKFNVEASGHALSFKQAEPPKCSKEAVDANLTVTLDFDGEKMPLDPGVKGTASATSDVLGDGDPGEYDTWSVEITLDITAEGDKLIIKVRLAAVPARAAQ